MKLTAKQRDTARAILREGPGHFTALATQAALNPATAWIDADLRGVVMEVADNLAGYVFLRTDLRGADLRRAQGKDRAEFREVIADETTLGLPADPSFESPEDYNDQAKAMILRGEAPPPEWTPHITRLEISKRGWTLGQRHEFSDLGLLAGLIALESLNLWGTHVRNLAPLAGLTALTSLIIVGAPLSDLAPLCGLTALTSLNLAATEVNDVMPLSGLTDLTSLVLWDAPVSDVAPLAGLTKLASLDLRGTQVNDVAPLATLTRLQALYVDPSTITNLDSLRHLRALRVFKPNETRNGTSIAELITPTR